MKVRVIALSAIFILFLTARPAQAQVSVGSTDIGGTVSAAIACADVGGRVFNGLNTLINSYGTQCGPTGCYDNKFVKGVGKLLKIGSVATGQGEVPTTDAVTQQKLEQQKFKETCLDKIAYNVAKQSLSKTTARTLNWVNTGFGGNPFYVVNQNAYFKSIADEQIKKYVEELPQKNNIFGESIRNNIISQITGRSVPQNSTSYKSKEFESFNQDFRNGGWDMWLLSVDGEYNPITSYINETGTLGKNIQNNLSTVQNELLQGQGFLSQKKCAKYENKSWMLDPNSPTYDPTYKPSCLEWKTVTPGTIIADQAKTALQTPFRQLENADEFNEVLGTLFTKILNNLLSKGIGGLGTYATADYSSFGGLGINTISGVSTIAGLSLDPASGITNVDVKNPGSIREVIKNQYSYLSAAHDSAKAMERIAPNLGVLDYCLPGPHQTWKNEFGQNIEPFVTAVVNAKEDGKFHDVQQFELYDFVTDQTFTKLGFGIQTQSGLSAFSNSLQSFFQSIPIIGNYIPSSSNILAGKQTPTTYIAAQFLKFFDMYATDIDPTFTTDAIVSQFTANEPDANKLFVGNLVKTSLLETQNLVDVYNNSSLMLADYATTETKTRENIRNLERIYAETLQIVTAARNRHIAKMAQQGYTVDLQCLNAAYDINPSYTARTNKEPNTTDTLVQAVMQKHKAFYDNVGPGPEENGVIDQYVEVKP